MTVSKKRLHYLVLIAILTFLARPALAFQDWWQCSSRKGGDWTYGRAPSICLVDHMQTQASVKNQYAPVLFDDRQSRSGERRRYMTQLNAFAKEVAKYYLTKRKPRVSQAELQAFTKGLLTLMQQETVWSHFRASSDQLVRYMRGDSGHGHGLMQVDDRSHQTVLLQGKGVDLANNMIYGLDVFYAAWQRAPSQSCVHGEDDYDNRIRAAWAAYNGGPSRLCRWTSTSGTYAHHDQQFYSKLKNQSFKSYITNENLKSDLNVSCLVEGTRPCANTGNKPIEVQPEQGQLYQVDSMYCLWGDSLECVNQLSDVSCLELEKGRSLKVQGLVDKETIKNKPMVERDRNQLCQDNVDGLYEVSQVIELKKNINIRKSPGGERLATASQNYKTKVVDFVVTSSQDQKRYYKINFNGVLGYVYAGDSQSYFSWAVRRDDSQVQHPVMASIGEDIKVVAEQGINLRQTPGGSYLLRVPNGVVLSVQDRVVRGSQNYLYYQVLFKGKLGYVYSGYLKNENSIESWTRVQRDQQTLSLKSGLSYRYLKTCPQADCDFSAQALKENSQLDQVQIVKQEQDWSYVTTMDASKKGWIRTEDLQAL